MASNSFSFDPGQLVRNFATPTPEQAKHKQEREALLNALDVLGGLSTSVDDKLVFDGDKFVFPARYDGDIPGVYKFLKEYERSQNAETSFVREFPARPHDGAAAMERTMKKLFGAVGAGIPTVTFFGSNPPPRLDVKT